METRCILEEKAEDVEGFNVREVRREELREITG